MITAAMTKRVGEEKSGGGGRWMRIKGKDLPRLKADIVPSRRRDRIRGCFIST